MAVCGENRKYCILKMKKVKKIKINLVDLFDGNLDRYYRWNIENAARVIVEDAARRTSYEPKESELTFMIYEAHKEVLKNEGYNVKKLELGDIELVTKVKGGLSKVLENRRAILN